MERRRATPQIFDLRHQLERALGQEGPATVSSARERILEQGFFVTPVTPAPARVVDFTAARTRSRF